jgi:hypothetical protein
VSYEYRVIWKREGWTSPVRRVYASEESAKRQIDRIISAVSWREPVDGPGTAYLDGIPVQHEGPWPVRDLLYIKLDRREVPEWERVEVIQNV